MTKINKLGKSTFVIAILSFLLVAVLAFGGTYAYFSDTSNSATSGDITLGTLIISEAELSESAVLVADSTFAVPNQQIIKGNATANVDANIGYYVRAIITTSFELADGHTCDTEGDDATCTTADQDLDNPIIFTVSTTDGIIMGSEGTSPTNDKWFAVVDGDTTYLYLKARQEADLALDLAIDARVNPVVGDDESQHFMGATFSISVQYQACQADYTDTNGTTQGSNLTDASSLANSAWKTLGIVA